jgi:hypothetical protein
MGEMFISSRNHTHFSPLLAGWIEADLAALTTK